MNLNHTFALENTNLVNSLADEQLELMLLFQDVKNVGHLTESPDTRQQADLKKKPPQIW